MSHHHRAVRRILIAVGVSLIVSCGSDANDALPATPATDARPTPSTGSATFEPAVPTVPTEATDESEVTESTGSHASQSQPSTAETQAGVAVVNFVFTPTALSVPVGASVTWTFEDTAAHNAVAKDSTFSSPLLADGHTWTHTFKTAGTYAYICTLHPTMTGTIAVE